MRYGMTQREYGALVRPVSILQLYNYTINSIDLSAKRITIDWSESQTYLNPQADLRICVCNYPNSTLNSYAVLVVDIS